jgi:hypothetical protein
MTQKQLLVVATGGVFGFECVACRRQHIDVRKGVL